MSEEMNPELVFKEMTEEAVESFGKGSQEGMKFAIKSCQDHFGCVSVSHQKQIAEAFGLDEKMVKAVIRFMPSVKESMIEFEIVCCTGSRCAKNGSIDVIRTIKSMTGIDFNQTTADGKIRLRSQNCFKQCKHGPNIMINGQFHHNMNKEKTQRTLEKILKPT